MSQVFTFDRRGVTDDTFLNAPNKWVSTFGIHVLPVEIFIFIFIIHDLLQKV